MQPNLTKDQLADALRGTEEVFRPLYESGFFLRPYYEAPHWMRDEPEFDAELDAKAQAADAFNKDGR